MVQAPFLMTSVRSLDTLWSLVCAKGGGGRGSQGRSAEISKALWEHHWMDIRAVRTYEGPEEGDQQKSGLQTTEIKSKGGQRPKSESGW